MISIEKAITQEKTEMVTFGNFSEGQRGEGQFLPSGPQDSDMLSADNSCPWVGWTPTRVHARDGKHSPYFCSWPSWTRICLICPPHPSEILNGLTLLLWSKQKAQENSCPTKVVSRSRAHSSVQNLMWHLFPGHDPQAVRMRLTYWFWHPLDLAFPHLAFEWKWARMTFQGLSEHKLSMQHTALGGSSERSHRLMGESLFCRKLFSESAWIRQRPSHL